MSLDDKALELFKKDKDSFLSGEEISSSLGISRQALWKHIEKLRDMGYVIEAVPHLGYKLLGIPDKLLVTELKWKLKTKVIGKEIHFYESVGSTNIVAYELAEKNHPEGTIVISDEQTKGKGRLGRNWFSPSRKGVYLSLILRPDIMPNEVPEITLVAAVSAIKAIRKFSGLEALIKWPNDILISDRKTGGILTELKAETDKVNFVILGMGINVNTPKRLIPDGGTSMKEESKSKSDFSRIEFTRILINILDEEYGKFRNGKFKNILDELKSYSCTLGRHVSIATGSGEKIKGKAIDINEKGALIIKLDDGTKRSFLSGDVTLVR